jgi:tRNA A-37 threonylcarbamoyl transferase component Bud32
MSASEPTPPSGLVAGKYEVLRLIGRGGMGSVWEGRHATLGNHVAIKFIDSEYAESKEARSRFETEARAAAALQSKHAIQIFDHGVTGDGRPYMVMELLQGEPLDDRIERLGRISLQETARVLVQVCRALSRAHDAGIIHRDLKPENIFLVRSPDDDEEIAKVLDFGIAKIKAPPGEQGVSSSTKTGAVLGTPYYMAPEQARGLRSIDYRADLWSLGIIAYKCVTGVLPFEGESVGDLLVKICTAPPPVPSRVLHGLPPAFDAWFARTMEREPAQRFTTATELADTLAVAAGITLRRGPASAAAGGPGGVPSGLPGSAGYASPYGPPPAYGAHAASPDPYMAPAGMHTPMPAAGMTSAPFVTSASPPRTSRGVLFGVVVAALLGGSIGVVGVVKLMANRAAETAAAGAGPRGTTASPDPATAANAATATPGAATMATSTAVATATTDPEVPPLTPTAPTATAGWHGGHPPTGHPSPTAKPTGAATGAHPPATAPPTATAAPPATTAKPAPTKQPPPSADPGY